MPHFQDVNRREILKTMTPSHAIEATDDGHTADNEEALAAWQYLVNTGLAWHLQGRFGRLATKLIERGHINPPTDGSWG